MTEQLIDLIKDENRDSDRDRESEHNKKWQGKSKKETVSDTAT